MRPEKTSHDSQGLFKTVVCVLAAVLILLISLPVFAADETKAEKRPEAEEPLIAEETKEEEGKDDRETVTENTEAGYVTMKVVSGNPSVTN